MSRKGIKSKKLFTAPSSVNFTHMVFLSASENFSVTNSFNIWSHLLTYLDVFLKGKGTLKLNKENNYSANLSCIINMTICIESYHKHIMLDLLRIIKNAIPGDPPGLKIISHFSSRISNSTFRESEDLFAILDIDLKGDIDDSNRKAMSLLFKCRNLLVHGTVPEVTSTFTGTVESTGSSASITFDPKDMQRQLAEGSVPISPKEEYRGVFEYLVTEKKLVTDTNTVGDAASYVLADTVIQHFYDEVRKYMKSLYSAMPVEVKEQIQRDHRLFKD